MAKDKKKKDKKKGKGKVRAQKPSVKRERVADPVCSERDEHIFAGYVTSGTHVLCAKFDHAVSPDDPQITFYADGRLKRQRGVRLTEGGLTEDHFTLAATLLPKRLYNIWGQMYADGRESLKALMQFDDAVDNAKAYIEDLIAREDYGPHSAENLVFIRDNLERVREKVYRRAEKMQLARVVDGRLEFDSPEETENRVRKFYRARKLERLQRGQTPTSPSI